MELRGYRSRESMRTNRRRRQFPRSLLKSLPRYRLFDPCIASGALSAAEMRNETRNVPPPSSPPSRRQLGGVVGIDPPLFSLSRRGYKHVRLGPFACCYPMTVTCTLRGTFPERTCTKGYAYPLVYFETLPPILYSLYSPDYPSSRAEVYPYTGCPPERGNSYFSSPVF